MRPFCPSTSTFSGPLRATALAWLVLLLSVSPVLADPDLPSPTSSVEVFPAGSLVIPMDNDKQNLDGSPFNLKAYGLVNKLLWDEIPLAWTIRAGKAKDGIDFSGEAARISPSAVASTRLDFRAGPFIVPQPYAADALPRIAAYGNAVAVYELTADTAVDLRYKLLHKPKVGVLDDGGNADIHRATLEAAGFVAGTHFEEISAATLLTINADSCFTIATEPHFSSSSSDSQAEALRVFTESGANFLAQCAAVLTYENNIAYGGFLTTGGLIDGDSDPTFLYPSADLSYSQFEGPLADAGGSLTDFTLAPGSMLHNDGHVHVQNTPTVDSYVAAVAKLRPGFGSLIFYLGGHSYDGSALEDLNGQRMYLNAVLTPSVRPPPCELNFSPTPEISGAVYEDVDGDGDLADGVPRPNVAVTLFQDDGDGAPGVADGLVATTTTDAGGGYVFSGLTPGTTYWVHVDSLTVTPAAGYVGGHSLDDVWAEQTWGAAGALCDDGAGGTSVRSAGGACHGGRRSLVPDAAATLESSEHVTRVLLGLSARGVDFGFSFSAVVNDRDAAERDGGGNRSFQGSLHQFLQNSNAVTGVQTSMFRIPTSSPGFDGSSFRIAPTEDMPVLTDPLVLDGTTQPGFAGTPIVELDGSVGGDGLVVQAGDSTIRGLVLNRFNKPGIELQTNGGNRIEGNYIGTDAAGTAALPNNGEGIKIRSAANVVGGPDPVRRNVISGNEKEGIKLDNGATDNRVEGNYVGTDVNGAVALPNGNAGILVKDDRNLIGGAVPGSGNLVAGNLKAGVQLEGADNRVQGNSIGVDATGAPLGNAEEGVMIKNASGNLVGGTVDAEANAIAYNGAAGVAVEGNQAGNVIRRNSIFENGALGIDLDSDGVTDNDPGDLDTGPNLLQNFPVLTHVLVTGGSVTVTGTLESAPGTAFDLEFFASPNPDASDYGEGRRFLGTGSATTDGSGATTFVIGFPGAVAGTEVVTSTATGPLAGTSEFSQDFTFVSIGGTIREDVDGDADLGDAVGRPNVRVLAYADGGDGLPTGGDDVLYQTTLTGAAGDYTINGVLPGTYWLVVDSSTLVPLAAFNSGSGAGDVWAEQTWGIAGALCDNGGGGEVSLAAAGPCYGGRRRQISDRPAALATSEHVIEVAVDAVAVGGVDFAFSHAVVVNARDADDDLGGNRSAQGTLRQFIQNGNALVGSAASIFRIATSDPFHDTTGFGDYTIELASPLPDVTEPLVLDATTQPDFAGSPLVAIDGNRTNLANGLRITGGDSTVRALVIQNFERSGIDLDVNGRNRVLQCHVGTDVPGTSAAGNDQYGIRIASAGNTVGAAGEGNLVCGSGLSGILISGANASGNVVVGNRIGIDLPGTSSLSNDGHGVEINGGASGNVVGGAVAGEGNVISGNALTGLAILGGGTTGNVVLGNRIGTDPAGVVDLRNDEDGVRIAGGASGNIVGGNAPAAANVISGNRDNGVRLTGAGTRDNTVLGNLIGADAAGATGLPNLANGVLVDAGASANTIGGVGAGNVIGGNLDYGVYLLGPGTGGNLVLGNLVGTDAAESAVLGNAGHGIVIESSDDNRVGGSAAGAGNTVAHNAGYGVYVTDSEGTVLEGNSIGTDSTGTADLGNADHGVLLEDSKNSAIGGTASGSANRIAYNAGAGVSVEGASAGNALRRNSIHDNDELGIDLRGNGVTPNDAGDVDVGPNALQNFPVLSSISIGGGGSTVTGTLNSRPVTDFTIEFFSNPAADPSEYGEGALYLGSAAVTTDGSGNASCVATLSTAVTPGDAVTATATDAAGNTSEFSRVFSGAISGTVFEDTDGDADLADATGRPGVGVRLYQDGGDDRPDGGDDTLIASVTTDGSGRYRLATPHPGRYWVVVDSSTLAPAAGFNGGAGPADVWAEQTWAVAGGYCDDGAGGTSVRTAPGPCHGGRSGVVADDASKLEDSEHVLGVWVNSLDIEGIDAAFSFSVVVNTSDDRDFQGGLQQFLANSEALAGRQVSLFRIPPADPGFDGAVFSIAPRHNLPALLDPLTLDGTTQPGFSGTPRIQLDGSQIGDLSPHGLVIRGGDSTLRGFTINRFDATAVRLETNGGNVVEGNYIGTDGSGALALGNGDVGIEVLSPDNRIGGTTPESGNVIAACDKEGLVLDDAADRTIVQGNRIGTDAGGSIALGNREVGVLVRTSDNRIGGTAPSAGNVVSANRKYGVLIDSGATGNLLQGNVIGSDPSGTLALGNGDDGVRVDEGDNAVGGTVSGAANTIAFNGGAGVSVDKDALRVTLRANRIFDNGGLGIDLEDDGVSLNDAGDADGGANLLQNFPLLVSADVAGGTTTVGGTLNSSVATTFALDFFASPAADPSGFGEGAVHLGSDTVTTDATGSVSFTSVLAVPAGAADVVTATATDPVGNTSEFGAPVAVVAAPVGISGRVYEDVDGDAGAADAAGRPAVGIVLYRDGGDGAPDGVDDVLVASTVTGATGDFSFSGVPAGIYWVVADSTTVTPAGGLLPGVSGAEPWAEQTTASPGGQCDDGGGATVEAAAAGACYGGRRRGVSDDASSLATAEHVVRANLSSVDATGIVFGFSFATVVHPRDGDDDPVGPRTIQGSLRQFVLNSNGIAGVQRSNFRLAGAAPFVVAARSALPDLTDPVVLDGSTQPGFADRPLVELDGTLAGAAVDGLRVTAGDSTVRAIAIGGFDGDGIVVSVTGGNVIANNHVGIDASGTAARANAGSGIVVRSPDNVVGTTVDIVGTGTTAISAPGNVVSANVGDGIRIDGPVSGNVVLGNRVGTDASGTAPLGNGGHGVALIGGASANQIGGLADAEGNLIAANAGDGIRLAAGATANRVIGNRIGSGPSGTPALGNTGSGVRLVDASGNSIGAPVDAAANDIAHNKRGGVVITGDSPGNPIRRNSIVDNEGLGIDLAADGPTPNDAGDADPGPNDLQNHPVLATADVAAGVTTVSGTLDSTPGTTFTVEYFANAAADPSGFGEGQTYVGSHAVTTDAGGTASWGFVLPLTLSSGRSLTATATAPSGSTSEFSAAVEVSATATADLSLVKTVDDPAPDVGSDVVFTLTVTNAGPADATAVDVRDLLPDGYTYAGDDGGGAYDEVGGLWNVGTIAAGASVSLALTATVEPSGEYTNRAEIVAADQSDPDSTPGNGTGLGEDDEAASATTPGSAADLSVTKDDGRTSAAPGEVLTYSIEVTNAGPAAVTGAMVTDAFDPSFFDVAAVSWTCSVSGGGACADAGPVAGDIATTVDLDADARATFTVSAPILPGASGTIVNSATVEPPGTVTDPVPGNNLDTDDDTVLQPRAELKIDKTDGVTGAAPGATLTYTIVVANAGPSPVGGAAVADLFDPAFFDVAAVSWTCAVTSGSGNCADPGPVAGDIATTVDLDVDAEATFTVSAPTLPGAAGTISNTATITPPAGVDDTNTADNSSTDGDTELGAVAELKVAKSDGVTGALPGSTLTYTITVDNDGPSDATAIAVEDLFDPSWFDVAAVSWSCAVTRGSGSCADPGPTAGDIATGVDLTAGAQATFTVSAPLRTDASGTIVNTASVEPPAGIADPDAANNRATDDDTVLTASADLAVTKSDGVTAAAPGDSVTYTITVANAGPANVVGAAVDDAFDPTWFDVVGVSWTCTVTSGTGNCADSGPTSGDLATTVDLEAGAVVTFTVTAPILAAATGTLSNTASVAPPSGTVDLVPDNDSATDDDTQLRAVADLSLSKDVDDPAPAIGDDVTFVLSVANAGPSAATGVVVRDLLPAGYRYVGDDAAAGGSSYDPASGLWTVGSLAPRSAVTLRIVAEVLPSGSYANLAEVAAANETDPDSMPDNGPGAGEDDDAGRDVSPVGADGVVTITPSLRPGEPLVLTVEDPDPDVDSAVADVVVVTVVDDATGESEDVTLTETGPSTGVFSATLPTVFGAAAGTDDDGALTVEAGHTLTATYLDALTSSPGAGSVPRTAVANVVGGATGTIEIPETFPPGDALTIRVQDPDLDTDAGAAESVTVRVVNDATGETEDVILTETAPDSGVFAGALGTTSGTAAGVAGDVTLVVQPGDTVTASYDDAFDATGGPVTVSATGTARATSVVLDKTAGRREVRIGEVVPYTLRARNATSDGLTGVILGDLIPAGFKYVEGSARLARGGADGMLGGDDDVTTEPRPSGPRPLIFGPLDLAAGETIELRYLLRVGSGAVQGEHVNRATPLRGSVPVGNTARASVAVIADPLFDRSTVLGKVFEDHDGDGTQDAGEPGVADAMVVLDDGTYALTDAHGRYHFPAVRPGQRLLKLNLHSLPPGTLAPTGDSRIVRIAPGLPARVNFGVVLRVVAESIGTNERAGVAVSGHAERLPTEVLGRTEDLSVLINDRRLDLPENQARLRLDSPDKCVRLEGNELEGPLRFELEAEPRETVERWSLFVLDETHEIVHRAGAEGPPPAWVEWDGRHDDGSMLVPGTLYEYQLELDYPGTRSTSTRRVFGVNRTTLLSLELSGDAFEVDRYVLSAEARGALERAVAVLEPFPDERIVVEGHTDAQGSEIHNLELSRRRAEAAANYLVDVLGFPGHRVLLRWFGESQPIAPNELPEGRKLNRRVTVKAEAEQVDGTQVTRRYRSEPESRINGSSVEVGDRGRFAASVEGADGEPLEIEVRSSQGRSARASVALPALQVAQPSGESLLAWGEDDGRCRAAAGPADNEPPIVCLLAARTDAGNTVELDGSPLELDADGAFGAELPLVLGDNTFGLLVRSPAGYSRAANLVVRVEDRDAEGRLHVLREAIPELTVQLPPPEVKLSSGTLPLSGTTAPGNVVTANGRELEVDGDGRFHGAVELPAGHSTLVVRVTDPAGRSGSIEREVEVARNQIFMLAFADGTFGQLTADGLVESTGLEEGTNFYSEGRLAFYLKGRIAGKYLITAAFDSSRDESRNLFGDVDAEDSRRLLRNLDPDRYYPVYGDEGSVVYDVESRGKFYLALESEEIGLVVGNYPLALTDTELAAYQRTFYGARFVYRSASQTSFGVPDTEVVVFTADVEHAHVHDELRATGGSLYYLSHRDVVEGSEEIALIVRDKNTGLVLQRERQQPGVDFTIKYEEGRVMFHRAVSSVVTGGTLVDREVLSGHPVYVHVDYETIVDDFEKAATGARVRRSVGDRVALGGTYVRDELEQGEYQLSALDAEVRLGRGSRLTAEFADSSGNDSRAFVSEDGGLSYTERAASGVEEGSAWKIAAELDVGEWFGRDGRYKVGLYHKELEPGFFSSGTFLEQGTEKSGLRADLQITDRDALRLRHDRERRTAPAAVAASPQDTTETSAAWTRREERWGISVELFSGSHEDSATAADRDSTLAAARFHSRWTDKLSGSVEQQQTLSGRPDDQTTLGIAYQALPSLALELRGTDGDRGSSAQAGAVWTRGESVIYLTERLSDDPLGRRGTTVLGARSPLGESSRVYTEYQLEDTDQGERAISLVGLQRQWDVAPGLRVVLSGEAADTASSGDAPDTGRKALVAGLTWSDGGAWAAQSRNQLRFEDGAQRRTQFLTFNHVDYRLGTDFTLQGKLRHSRTRNRGSGRTEARFDERSLGIAYRPTTNDRFNSLARYTRLSDLRPLSPGDPVLFERRMDVLAVETILEVLPRLERVAKGATRLQRERFAGLPESESRSFLAIQRVNFGFRPRFDLGLEYRVLHQREADDSRQGWLGEVSYELMRYFRVGGGYNFTDFSDNEFSQNDYSVRGWFIRVQGRY